MVKNLRYYAVNERRGVSNAVRSEYSTWPPGWITSVRHSYNEIHEERGINNRKKVKFVMPLCDIHIYIHYVL
jgi:hypothetical protein